MQRFDQESFLRISMASVIGFAIVFSIFVMFLLVSAIAEAAPPKPPESQKTVLLQCNSVACVTPAKDADKKSTHIAFPLKKGKALLKEIKTHRQIAKKKDELAKERQKINDNRLKWRDEQLKHANKTIDHLSLEANAIKKDNVRLRSENHDLAGKVAKYRGQRFQFLIIGVGVGIGFAVVGGVVVAILIAQK